MKITITDGSSTVILENTETMDSAKTRRLLDVLFSVEPNRASRRTPTAVTPVVDSSPEIPSLPLEPREFRLWLNDRSPGETADMLSSYVGADVTKCSNVHTLITTVPEFAHKLGYTRYILAVKWLNTQGWIYSLPQLSSMKTYYSKSLRLVAANA